MVAEVSVDGTGVADVEERLAALERAAAAAAGRVGTDLLGEVDLVGERIRERLGLSHGHTVVALAGPSGVGRSTLLNAVAGLDLAWVGALRPTTSEPLACVWGMYEARPLLDWLGVPRRHQFSRESALDSTGEAAMQGLILLDLPALDTADEEQRSATDRLLERVDGLVWVVDPTKYADQVVHERYLRRFAAYGGVSVVVFNRIDELPAEQARVCLDELAVLLRADGLGDVPVVATSGVTGSGVAELRGQLGAYVPDGRAMGERLAADVVRCSDRLAEAVGVAGAAGEPSGGQPLAGRAKEALVSELVAIARTGHIRSAGARAHLDRTVRQLVGTATSVVPAAWGFRLSGSMTGRIGELAEALEAAGGTDSDGRTEPRRSGERLALSILGWLLIATGVVGLVWLFVPLLPGDWPERLGSPRFSLPDEVFGFTGLADVPAIPVAALVAAGGLLSGLGLVALGRSSRRGSAEPSAEAEQQVRERIAEAAERLLFQPLEIEIAAYRTYVRSLQQARHR